ncbi:MAG TPA: aldose 1-epimerase [Bryobacteraceae bacterium]|jgi:aldose 1-epimerase|nr:aldose 1-epimerase [Bryobacteraceae bacterium]
MKNVAVLLIFSIASIAQNYKAEQASDHDVPVVHLVDASNGVEVSILPSIGNRAYEMKVHGKNILYFPISDLSQVQKTPGLNGIPFLAPWANRLGEQAFWANGKKYPFNMTLGNVRGPIPIHGLLSSSGFWHVTEAAADALSAHVTSKLEFWKYPELMAQWPFAHEYEMTYRLAGGVLEVQVTVTNLSSEAMPISLGYHPYYRIPDVSRDEWTVHLAARKMIVADNRLVATGEFKPNDLPDPLPLKSNNLDTGFTDLERDADGRAHFLIESGGKRIEVTLGPKFGRFDLGPTRTSWPDSGLHLHRADDRDYECFEPEPRREIPGPAKCSPRRQMDGKFLDPSQRDLTVQKNYFVESGSAKL